MGFKKSDDPKTTHIQVRVTPEQKEQILANAKDCMMSMSDYICRVSLGRQTRTQHDLNLVNELRAIADLLRETYASEKPRDASELEPVLMSVIQAIDRIGTESRIRL